MYSKEQIKEIIKENHFSTKVSHTWKSGCLILVPNFKEYSFLFGGGRTRTCYAYAQRYWDDYHKEIFREIDFLSVSDDVIKQYQYITFCLRVNKIDFGEYNNGGSGIISGYISVHDLNHYNYSFSFSTSFHRDLNGKPYIDEDFIRVDLDINVLKEYLFSSMKFVDFCSGFGKRGLLPTVIKIGCTDILKKAIKDGISNN
jgi:hypothetical protein